MKLLKKIFFSYSFYLVIFLLFVFMIAYSALKVFRKQIADIEKKNKLLTDEDCHRELTQIMFRGATRS